MKFPQLVETKVLVDRLNDVSCAVRIEAAIRRLPGVAEVSSSVCTGVVVVSHIQEELIVTAIERSIQALGHKVARISEESKAT